MRPQNRFHAFVKELCAQFLFSTGRVIIALATDPKEEEERHERKELGARGADSVWDDDSDDDSMHHHQGLHFVALFYFVKVLDFSARFSYNRNGIFFIVYEL